MSDQSQFYKVEAILDKRKRFDCLEYLIKWEGWDIQDSTWQPYSNLKFVSNMVEEFQRKEQESSRTVSSFNYSAERNFGEQKQGFVESRKKIMKEKESERKVKREEAIMKKKAESKKTEEYEENDKSSSTVTNNELEESEMACTIKILGMRKQGKDYWFYITEANKHFWVLREYIVKNYPVSLCEFYQSRMVFD